MKKIIIFFSLVFIIALTQHAGAQVMTEETARAEIRKRGLDEEEVIKELEKRGIKLEEIDVDNPAEISRAETVIRQVIAELEAKKNETGMPMDTTQIPLEQLTEQQSKEAAKNSEEVTRAIEEGATLEEAVSETLQENANDKLKPTGVYGRDIFRNGVLKEFRRVENAQPPASYMLGPGDKVAINIWGASEISEAFEISTDGYIRPPQMSRIYLTGLTITRAKEKLLAAYSRNAVFNKNNFDVTLSTARTITVNIVGEVESPGSYTISALNTAFNALVAAGGPNNIGSVRNIQLLRGGEVLEVDVYDFLKNPSVSNDFYLMNNSYINVPVAQKVVSIAGAVRRPIKYELKNNEGLKELIDYAGGLEETAIRKNIQIRRIENDAVSLIDVNYRDLEKAGRNFQLYPGDRIMVNELEDEFENIVSIIGAVRTPGDYALEEGMRISDLIARTEFKTGAILDSTYLKRFNADRVGVNYRVVNLNSIIANPDTDENIELQPGDQLILRSVQQFSDAFEVEVLGAVRNPGVYPFDRSGNLRVSDLIFLAEGLNENAESFGYIYRKNPDKTKGLIYQEVDVKQVIQSPGGSADLLLKGGDRLQIFSKALYEDEFFVTISGAVRNSDTFRYDGSLRIKDVVKLAGGFTLEANPTRVDVYRVDLSNEGGTKVLAAQLSINEDMEVEGGQEFALLPYDQIYVRTKANFELQRLVRVEGEVKYPGTYAILDDNEKLASMISRAGGVTTKGFLGGSSLYRNKDQTGYVILNFEEALSRRNSPENAILQAGDVITIPKRQSLVTIEGATRARELYPDEFLEEGKFTVPYVEGKNAKHYIDKYAGGIADAGDAGKISVNYANGEYKETSRFLLWRSFPEVREGATIRVGYKDVEPEQQEGEKSDVDWGEVLSDSVAQAMSVLTLVLLLQRID